MHNASSPPKRSLLRHMVEGSLWGVGMRWTMRLIGVASVAILARLLTPADFGLVAMATVFMALIGSFGHLGLGQMLIRTREPTREDCDTAWTLGLLQQSAVTLLILLASPLAVRYFNEPRLYPVIAIIAISAAISATANVGMTLARKELDFAKDFRFQFYGKLATFVPTVALAFAWRNYWALVMGTAVGSLIKVAMSYRMHPYRPRLCFAKARAYLSFSVYIVGMVVAKFLKQKLDVMVVGGKGHAAAMGAYNVASELAAMATQEIVIAVWRGLYPSFATITHDRPRFLQAYGHLLCTMAIVCLPLGFGLSAVAHDAVLVVLGAKWVEAVGPLQWLAITSTLLALIDAMSHHILILSGHERRAMIVMWLQLAVLAPLVIFASGTGSMENIAMATTAASAIMLPVVAVILARSIGFGYAMMVSALSRPVLATAAMVGALELIAMPAELPAIARLCGDVVLGAAVYGASLTLLWLLAGRPEGFERTVWGIASRTIRRVAA